MEDSNQKMQLSFFQIFERYINTEMKLGRFAHCKCWKSEGCKRTSRSNMIPISNFFPLSRFIFFFSSLFSLFVRSRCFHTREMHTRNKYRRTWKTHCIDTLLFGLMHDKLSHARTYRHHGSGHRGGWTAISLIARFYPLCAILSATRDAPDAPRVLDFHRLSFIAAENIENIFVYRAPRTPSKTHPFTITAAGSKYGLHSSLVSYFNILTFHYLLFPLSPFFPCCFLCYCFPNTSFAKLL